MCLNVHWNLDPPTKDEDETLHFYGQSTSEHVSLLPSKAEGKKVVIEDYPEVLEEELIYRLKRTTCCYCLGAKVYLPEGQTLSQDLKQLHKSLVKGGQETPQDLYWNGVVSCHHPSVHVYWYN
jgi:hypothetical protein